MKITGLTSLAFATVFGIGLMAPTQAEAGFHFPVGIVYSQGGHDAINRLADAYEADWSAQYGTVVTVDKINIPIGLTLDPYYEWNNGLGVGVDIGPTLFMEGTLKNAFGTSSDTKFSYIVPVGASVRYTLFRTKNISPYVRVGVRYPFAGGDNIGSPQPGPFVSLGVELWHTKRIGMAAEVGYDASEVKIESVQGSERTTFAGFTAGLSVVF